MTCQNAFREKKKSCTPVCDKSAKQCRTWAQFITNLTYLQSKAIPFVQHADTVSSKPFSQPKGMRDWLYHAGFIVSWMMQTCSVPEQWPRVCSPVKTKIALARHQILELSGWCSDFPWQWKSSEWSMVIYRYPVWLSFSIYQGEVELHYVPRCETYRGNCTYLLYVLYGNLYPGLIW